MEIGDEVKLRGTVVDLDNNPYGSAVQVRILGFLGQMEIERLQKREEWRSGKKITFVNLWIHRLDQPQTLIDEKS